MADEERKEQIGVQLVGEYADRWNDACERLRRKKGEMAKWVLEEWLDKQAERYLAQHEDHWGEPAVPAPVARSGPPALRATHGKRGSRS